MKACNKCDITKPFSDFQVDNYKKDRLSYYCKPCRAIQRHEAYEKHKEREKARTKAYYTAHSEFYKDYRKKWNSENKEKMAKLQKQWQKNNLEKAKATTRQYFAMKRKATPKWLSKGHWQEIEEIYQLRDDLQWLSEEPLEVDHIMPLKGKNSCGLHVPWNLQILPRSKNIAKSNKESVG